jgi:uncharacterized protein YdeI (YjbR/CyaY-like superfamily)
MTQSPDIQILPFKNQVEWRLWLEGHHLTLVEGIWLQLYKKGSSLPSVTYAEALDEALCFGWIDGQKKSFDGESLLQKFTPRRKRSLWSRVNIGHIERLESLGLLRNKNFDIFAMLPN